MKMIKSQNNGAFLIAFECNPKPDSAWLPSEMFPVFKKIFVKMNMMPGTLWLL